MKIPKYSWFFSLLDVSHGNLISCPQSSYLKQNDVSRVSSCGQRLLQRLEGRRIVQKTVVSAASLGCQAVYASTTLLVFFSIQNQQRESDHILFFSLI